MHKVRHAGGGPRKCDSLWQRGGGVKIMWRHAYKFFYQTWNLKWFLIFCCNRCILTEGVGTKKHPGQNLPDKRPSDKTPGQKLQQTIETEFAQGALVRVFCTRPSKNRGGGSEMCDILFGGSRDVWQGEGSQNWPKIAWRTLWTAPITMAKICKYVTYASTSVCSF